MAYVLRYYMNFKDDASGLPVVVNISFPDFVGTALELIPADTPLVVSELNSDENIFSAIRAKEFRIKFITDNSVYPGINEFATNNDNDWKIDILVDGALWLTGFILTDQISEGWYADSANHYIELVATDNLGTLKSLSLKDMDGNDFIPTSKQFLIDVIKPALNQAVEGLVINIFDNLFEISFNDRSQSSETTYTGILLTDATAATKQLTFLLDPLNFSVGDTFILSGSVSNDGTYTIASIGSDPVFSFLTVLETVVDESGTAGTTLVVTNYEKQNDSYQQCKVDMRTFTVNYNTFEDAYTVLEKILGSRNSVLFQHMGEWYIIRVSELFRSDVINGTKYNPDDTIEAIINASWTADVNESGDIIPVEQFMIKSYLNPVLSNKVTYNYKNFDEFFCNELWKRGAIQADTPTLKEYDVDCWSHYQGATISTTPASVLFRRRDVVNATTDLITESYIFLEHETGSGGESFVRSEGAQVNADDKLTISFSRRLKNGYTGAGTEILARVLLYAYDSTYYTLDDDGLWYLSNSTFTVNNKTLLHSLGAADNRDQWREKTVECDYIPKAGNLYIHLQEGSASVFTGQETHFKDLKITYISYLEGKTFVNVEGDFHKLTLSTALKDTKDYEVFLSDSPKYLFKGALFQDDGLTLTTLWYEMDFPTVRYPIKRFNAIDHYRMSNRNMLKADGSFYKWIKEGEPLITLQKITINNGDPNKRFIPSYTRDLNTSKSRFGALFIEVYDTSKEGAPVTFAFTLIGEFKAPDSFDFYAGYDIQSYFNIGDSIVITDTASNNVTVTVDDITIAGAVYTVILSGATITDEFLSTEATFTNTRANSNLVNAAHEFNYIFKAK